VLDGLRKPHAKGHVLLVGADERTLLWSVTNSNESLLGIFVTVDVSSSSPILTRDPDDDPVDDVFGESRSGNFIKCNLGSTAGGWWEIFSATGVTDMGARIGGGMEDRDWP